MSDRGFYTLGLISAILSMVAWIVYVVFDSGAPDPLAIEDSSQIFLILWEGRQITYLYGWGGCVGSFLVIPYILAFQYAFRRLGPWFWLATVTTVVGSVLAAVGFMAGSLAFVYSLVPLGLDASTDQIELFAVAMQVAGDLIEVTWFVGSFLAFSVGIGLFALATFRLAPVAKWISIIGIVAGLSGLAWLTFFFPALESIAFFPRIVNILGIFIWSIAMAVVVRRHASEWEGAGSTA